MQFLVISHQIWEILWAFILGSFLGLVYDGIRCLRRLMRPIGSPILWANIFDILYGIFFATAYCIFVYVASSGHFRWFTALGTVGGLFVWRALPSRILLPVMYFLADKLIWLMGLAFYPLRAFLRYVVSLVKKIYLKAGYRLAVKKTDRYKRQLAADVCLSK